jgi:hypothetical protein
MLDFNNLNYYPSLMVKNDTPINNVHILKGDPIISEAHYLKTLVDQLYSTLELNKVDISKIDIRKSKSVRISLESLSRKIGDIHTNTMIDVQPDKANEIRIKPNINQELQNFNLVANEGRVKTYVNTNIDALASLEGRARASLERSITSLSSSDRFSTFFYDSTKDQAKIEERYDDLLERFQSKLDEIFHHKEDFIQFLDKFNHGEQANSESKSVEEVPLSLNAEYFSNPDDFYKEESNDQGLSTNLRNIQAIDKVIINLKAQIIEFDPKIDLLDKVIADFKAISAFDDSLYDISSKFEFDADRLKTLRDKLQSLDDLKYSLLQEFNAKNDNINNLIAKKKALMELNRSVITKNESMLQVQVAEGKLKANISVNDLLDLQMSIADLDRQIVNLKDQFTDFHNKNNQFDRQIAGLNTKKIQLKELYSIDKDNFSEENKSKLKSINQQLKFLMDAKNNLINENTLNNNLISKLEAQKSTFVERSIYYKKELGDLANTPIIQHRDI